MIFFSSISESVWKYTETVCSTTYQILSGGGRKMGGYGSDLLLSAVATFINRIALPILVIFSVTFGAVRYMSGSSFTTAVATGVIPLVVVGIPLYLLIYLL